MALGSAVLFPGTSHGLQQASWCHRAPECTTLFSGQELQALARPAALRRHGTLPPTAWQVVGDHKRQTTWLLPFLGALSFQTDESLPGLVATCRFLVIVLHLAQALQL